MELPPRPTLFDFHGVSMVKYFTDNWDNIQNFKARPDDILIATYPKAGTTWVSYILDLLYFGQTCPEREASIPINERVPFLELSIPTRPKAHEKWGKHSVVWFRIQVLIVSQLSRSKLDTGRELDQLCSFLGLSPSLGEKERVAIGSKFDNMKQNNMTNYSTVHTMNQKVSPFMRKGIVGDWKTHFTVSQNEEFDKDYKQKMTNPTLKFHTEVYRPSLAVQNEE
uniref:cytosolic sulfotransferase 2-like n=1 Tax=Monopterus albus TaxID=43700 RepID=UPI0009B32298|nr:cytosolic sulfotransferase 2-like [Monopterus albus]